MYECMKRCLFIKARLINGGMGTRVGKNLLRFSPVLIHPVLQKIVLYLTSGRGASSNGCFPTLTPQHP